MGRKVNPIGFRLGIVSDWESKWFAERNYTEQLQEDIKIRELVMKELQRAGISKVELERSANKVDVTLHTSKPGIVIGKQGANVERIRQLLEKEVGKKVHLKIEEIKVPEIDARLIAESIAEQIGRRVAYRRAMKHAVQQAMRRGAKGVKIRLWRSPRWRRDEPDGDGDGRPGAAAHAARGHRLRRRPRAHDIWPDRRQGLGLQGRSHADPWRSDRGVVDRGARQVGGRLGLGFERRRGISPC